MRHAHDLMLIRAQGPRAADVEADEEGRRRLAEQAARFSEATLVYAVTVFSEALRNARQLGEGRLFAETALARLAGHRELRFLDQVVRELHALEKKVGQPSAVPSPPAGAPGSSPGRAQTGGAPAAAQAGPPSPASSAPVAPREFVSAVAEAPPDGTDAPPAESPPSPAGADAGAVSLDALRARWGEVRDAAAKGNALLRAALQSADVADFGAGVVTLGFASTAAFHRAKADEPPSRERIEAALASFFGPGLRVATILRDSSPPAAADPEVPRADAPPERLTAAEAAAVRDSPITRLVERELGGQIVQMQREE
jgi:hypothetical protein